MTCEEIRESLAAHALGALGPVDASDADAHLENCADCRAAFAEFSLLSGLLSRTTADDIINGVEPAPDLLERTLATLRARRTKRRVAWRSVAAAVLLISSVAVGYAVTRPTAPGRSVVAASDPATHVSASISLASTTTGTNLWLTLDGVESGEHCQLIAVAADGTREVAASWQASYEGTAKIQGMTALAGSSLRGFEIATMDGRHLVWVAAPKKPDQHS